jgi:hypothetical protein
VTVQYTCDVETDDGPCQAASETPFMTIQTDPSSLSDSGMAQLTLSLDGTPESTIHVCPTHAVPLLRVLRGEATVVTPRDEPDEEQTTLSDDST